MSAIGDSVGVVGAESTSVRNAWVFVRFEGPAGP